MSSSSSYVFVYGTLRNGQINHHFLKDAKLITRQASLKGEMYNTGKGYPAFLLNGQSQVYGEIYQIDEKILSQLDILEDYSEGCHSNLYYRIRENIKTDTSFYNSWVYVLDSSQEASLNEKIPFQDWNVYQWYTSFEHVNYFAYGSCMDTERIKKAGMMDYFSNEVKVGKLVGYRFAYSFPRPDGARADIIESNQEEYVEGIVYSLTKNAIDYLFEREGVYLQYYRPTFVTLEIDGEKHENVLTFTVINKYPCSAPPKHYATEILRGARGRLSDGYIQKLRDKLDEVN
ncbi:gamma-glutamylcyclotransferase [Salipaludibacillus sp. HK11]|uniref:gamma-glutamylcyclotransferase n=1 Tax=Salipaludibacillus sp. HK11 TaxID=3394320 RepID=UPI0039FBDBF9